LPAWSNVGWSFASAQPPCLHGFTFPTAPVVGARPATARRLLPAAAHARRACPGRSCPAQGHACPRGRELQPPSARLPAASRRAHWSRLTVTGGDRRRRARVKRGRATRGSSRTDGLSKKSKVGGRAPGDARAVASTLSLSLSRPAVSNWTRRGLEVPGQ
jgi:hypothetical protein